MPDIAHQLAAQVRDGGENTACGHVALNLCKPELDLVQPGRIGRRVVELNVGMSHQERPDLLRFVCGQVVDDDVDLATTRLRVDHVLEKRDEFLARMPGRCLAQHLARARVQRRIERQRAMPDLLKPMALRASGCQRQDRVQPIQRLNRGFLIDAKHRGMLRRVDIQPDDVSRFRLKVGIVRAHVPLEPMRFSPARCHARATIVCWTAK